MYQFFRIHNRFAFFDPFKLSQVAGKKAGNTSGKSPFAAVVYNFFRIRKNIPTTPYVWSANSVHFTRLITNYVYNFLTVLYTHIWTLRVYTHIHIHMNLLQSKLTDMHKDNQKKPEGNKRRRIISRNIFCMDQHVSSCWVHSIPEDVVLIVLFESIDFIYETFYEFRKTIISCRDICLQILLGFIADLHARWIDMVQSEVLLGCQFVVEVVPPLCGRYLLFVTS